MLNNFSFFTTVISSYETGKMTCHLETSGANRVLYDIGTESESHNLTLIQIFPTLELFFSFESFKIVEKHGWTPRDF